MCRLLGYAAPRPTTAAEVIGGLACAEWQRMGRLHCDGWGTAWLDELGTRVWHATGARLGAARGRRPALAGLAWALVPCGLLYSALATAALASDPLRGAAAMVAFAAGTAVNLLAAQWALHAIGRGCAGRAARIESTGIRIGGALLAAMSAAALVALALGQPHPFCAS